MSEVVYERQRTPTVKGQVLRYGPEGNGGAHFHYQLSVLSDHPHHPNMVQNLQFQQGHMDQGLNGVLDDQLLAVVQHRWEAFQAGPFACEETAKALEHISAAIACVDARVARRTEGGIHGKMVETAHADPTEDKDVPVEPGHTPKVRATLTMVNCDVYPFDKTKEAKILGVGIEGGRIEGNRFTGVRVSVNSTGGRFRSEANTDDPKDIVTARADAACRLLHLTSTLIEGRRLGKVPLRVYLPESDREGMTSGEPPWTHIPGVIGDAEVVWEKSLILSPGFMVLWEGEEIAAHIHSPAPEKTDEPG